MLALLMLMQHLNFDAEFDNLSSVSSFSLASNDNDSMELSEMSGISIELESNMLDDFIDENDNDFFCKR